MFHLVLALFPMTFLISLFLVAILKTLWDLFLLETMLSVQRANSTSSLWPSLLWAALKWLVPSAQCCTEMMSYHLCLGSDHKRGSDDHCRWCCLCWSLVISDYKRIAPVSSLPFLACSVRAELYPSSAHLPAGTRLSHPSCCGGIIGRRDCPCCSSVLSLSCCFAEWLSCCTECQRASSSVCRALLTPGVSFQVHQHTHIPGWPRQTLSLSSWPLDTPSPTSSESQLGRRGLLFFFPSWVLLLFSY